MRLLCIEKCFLAFRVFGRCDTDYTHLNISKKRPAIHR